MSERNRNVVLVHGGFVDGSGWAGVYRLLTAEGFRVSVVQNPTFSLAGDVTATRDVLDDQAGPVVLVGHSYGGVVVSEAGAHEKGAAGGYVGPLPPGKGGAGRTLVAGPPP